MGSLLRVALGALVLVGAFQVLADHQPPEPEHKEDPAVYERLRAAVRQEPESAEAWRQLGNHCYAYHRSEEAIEAWRESLRLEPQQAELLWSIGTVYSGQGNDEAAQREYEAALAIDPDHEHSLHNLGVIYKSQGRLEEAEHLLEKAAARSQFSLSSLGDVYAEQGRWEEAADAFERSLSNEGLTVIGLALVHADLGRAQLELGRDAEAILSLERALELVHSVERHPLRPLDPKTPALMAYRLARLHARGGDLKEGLRYLKMALSRDPDLRVQAATEPDLELVRRLPEAVELQL